jgi:uncharacterized protein
MSPNKFYTVIILFCAFCFQGFSQENSVLTSINKSTPGVIKIKWYSKKLVYPEGVNIYQKESGSSTWKKINANPVKKGDYKPTSEELQKDPELKSYMDMVNSVVKLEGVAMLGAFVKTFKSDAFSRYIGIAYMDNTVAAGKSVQYKICLLKGGIETELGVSAPVIAGTPTIVLPPQNIVIVPKNKKTEIKWMPETSRYYGVNIYRMFDSTGKDRLKVNKDPIIVSKTKNKKGTYEYPEQFYIEEKLKEDTVYYYSFKAIDFFGEESDYCAPINVFIKDLNAPIAPIRVKREVKQKTIRFSWRKADFEKDFIGYRIYKAKGSSMDFTQVTTKLLAKTDTQFVETGIKNGSYRYVIAAIDQSGNEGVTEEIPADIIDEEPPSVPQELSISADTGKIVLTWKKSPEPDVWGYMVYQTVNKNTRDGDYVLITPQPVPQNEFRQELAKNSKNKFLYKVLAIDSSYNKSQLSDFAVTTLPDVVAPSAPFIVNAALDEKRHIRIEFFKNPELDLKGYELFRVYKDKDVEQTEKVNGDIIAAASTQYTDRAFEKEGVVGYYLIAIDSTNNRSQKSNLVRLNVKREDDVKKYEIKRFEVKQVKKTNQWKLNWEINEKENVFYVVYAKQEGDENFEPMTQNLTESNVVMAPKSKTKLLVQVRAYNSKGLLTKSEIKQLQQQ